VIDDENEGGDCHEVICTGWGKPGGEWTEWGWRNEEGSWFHVSLRMLYQSILTVYTMLAALLSY